MDALRRNQYLQTIGVDVWVPRRPVASEADSRAATAASEAPAPMAGIAASAARGSPAAEAGTTRAATSAHAAPSSMAGIAVSAGRGSQVAEAGTMTVTSRAPAATQVADVMDGSSAHDAVTPTLKPPAGTTTWESLRSEVLACTKCPLHASRTQGVFGVGNREAQWLVVGEAPGAEEDRRGEPFVGRAGHLLDAMLKAIGLSRGRNVYIANVLKSRPPGNRDPKPEEVAACLPYLMRQIELLKPRVMLAVGRIAAQNLLATDTPLGRLRGKVHHFGELNTPLIVTYHPAYLLRTPGDKRKAWEDLKFARSVFQGLNPT